MTTTIRPSCRWTPQLSAIFLFCAVTDVTTRGRTCLNCAVSGVTLIVQSIVDAAAPSLRLLGARAQEAIGQARLVRASRRTAPERAESRRARHNPDRSRRPRQLRREGERRRLDRPHLGSRTRPFPVALWRRLLM